MDTHELKQMSVAKVPRSQSWLMALSAEQRLIVLHKFKGRDGGNPVDWRRLWDRMQAYDEANLEEYANAPLLPERLAECDMTYLEFFGKWLGRHQIGLHTRNRMGHNLYTLVKQDHADTVVLLFRLWQRVQEVLHKAKNRNLRHQDFDSFTADELIYMRRLIDRDPNKCTPYLASLHHTVSAVISERDRNAASGATGPLGPTGVHGAQGAQGDAPQRHELSAHEQGMRAAAIEVLRGRVSVVEFGATHHRCAELVAEVLGVPRLYADTPWVNSQEAKMCDDRHTMVNAGRLSFDGDLFKGVPRTLEAMQGAGVNDLRYAMAMMGFPQPPSVVHPELAAMVLEKIWSYDFLSKIKGLSDSQLLQFRMPAPAEVTKEPAPEQSPQVAEDAHVRDDLQKEIERLDSAAQAAFREFIQENAEHFGQLTRDEDQEVYDKICAAIKQSGQDVPAGFHFEGFQEAMEEYRLTLADDPGKLEKALAELYAARKTHQEQEAALATTEETKQRSLIEQAVVGYLRKEHPGYSQAQTITELQRIRQLCLNKDEYSLELIEPYLNVLKNTETTMADPKTETTTEQTFVQKIAAKAGPELTEVGWRTAGSQFHKLNRDVLAAWMARHIDPNDEGLRAKVSAFIKKDELGGVILDSMLSVGLAAVPVSVSKVAAPALSKEMRVRAMAEGGDLFADLFMGPLREFMATAIQDVEAIAPKALEEHLKELPEGIPDMGGEVHSIKEAAKSGRST